MNPGTPNARKLLVIGAGEVLWDLLPAGKQLGGAPANFAYHAQDRVADFVCTRPGAMPRWDSFPGAA